MNLEKYAIKVSLISEYGDEEVFEIVPTVSYEQGAEALARLVRQYEKKVDNQNIQDDE
jgi:hypothetical protein